MPNQSLIIFVSAYHI